MLIIDRFQHYSTLRLFRFHPLFTRVFGWKRAFEARIRAYGFDEPTAFVVEKYFP